MENGRSPVLGSSLPESEGTELMEGAAAAVGRQQSPGSIVASITTSYCSIPLHYFSSGFVEFQLASENQQDHSQKSIQAPPTKKSGAYLAESVESTLSRPPTLHKQPPALLPKPFNRLPNHITGEFALIATLHVHICPAHAFTLCTDGAPVKLPCMSVKLSPPLPPKKLMISVPAGSMEPPSLAFQKCPAPPSHAPMGGHSLQYGPLPVPLHPPSRIIEELNKTLALTMQRFERWISKCQKLTSRTKVHHSAYYPVELSCCCHPPANLHNVNNNLTALFI